MSRKIPFYERYPSPNQQIHRGICFPGFPATNTTEGLAKIREFEVREDDVVLLAHPKTGSRWMSAMISWVCNGDDRERMETTSYIEQVRHLEFHVPPNPVEYLNDLPATTQRIYTSHLMPVFAPEGIDQKAGRIIIGVRNPKDTAVSKYHYKRSLKMLGNYDGTWDEFLQAFVDGDLPYGSYFDWLVNWWPITHQDNVMILKYEDARKFPEKTIKALAAFLGKPLSEDRMRLIVERTGFAVMKEKVKILKESSASDFIKDQTGSRDDVSMHYRKGVVGDWKSYFTVKQNEEFDEVIKTKLAGIELHFDYQ